MSGSESTLAPKAEETLTRVFLMKFQDRMVHTEFSILDGLFKVLICSAGHSLDGKVTDPSLDYLFQM